jgi:hypothetical protein
MIGDAIGSFFNGILTLLAVFFILTLLGAGYFIFSLFQDHKTIKTKEKPAITWELKAKGQTVSTVWIYKFK